MFARLFAVSLLLSLVPLAAAAGVDGAPNASRWVDATMDLEQPDLTHMLLTGTLDLHKHRIAGRTYTASGMADAYRDAETAQPGSGSAFLTTVEGAVRTDLDAMLAKAFPTAERTITKVDVVESSLTATRVDDYHPAIRVDVAATIVRTPASLGLGTLGTDAIAAAFASGADISSDVSLVADPGYDVTYLIRAPASPAGLTFTQLSTGAVSADARTVTVLLQNAARSTILTRAVTLHVVDGTAVEPPAEDLSTLVDVRLGKLEKGVTTVPVDATIETRLAAIDLATRFPGLLPSGVDLDVLSADGLRALRQAGAVSDASLDDADARLLETARSALAGLGEGATVTGGLSRDDLRDAAGKPYDGAPPVHFLATASSLIPIPGENADNADLALSLGAKVRLDLTLSATGGETTYQLHPPAGAEFTDVRGGTVNADGLTATFTVPAGTSAPVGLSLRAVGARSYDTQVAGVDVVIDLRDIDIKVSEAMNGDMGDVVVDLTVKGTLAVVALPDDVKASLGETVELDHLSSDAVRILLARGLLTQAQLDELTASLLDRISESLGGDVSVEGGFVQATLAESLVSSPPSADTPILFEAKGSFRKPLSGDSAGAAALDLYTVLQTFNFPKVEDFDTVYTVVLPRGLAVTDVQATGGEAKQTTWTDGRDAFTVTPSSSTATATVGMSVTPTFVMIKFWPIVLGAVVLLVLVIGTPIAIVVLRRRKKA